VDGVRTLSKTALRQFLAKFKTWCATEEVRKPNATLVG